MINTNIKSYFKQSEIKNNIRQNWFFYLWGIIFVLVIKYWLSAANADSFNWILAPTAKWTEILSGIPFIRESPLGYVNHEYNVVIELSCCGAQFLSICFITLIFSFINRMNTLKNKFYWLFFSLGFSYFFTVFVNGFRIIFAIPLLKTDIYSNWLTSDRLHMLEGTAVYFVSLFILFQIADFASRKLTKIKKCRLNFKLPLLCYLGVVLGIPFVNRFIGNSNENFTEYAVLIAIICVIICCLYVVIRFCLKRRMLHDK